MRLRLRLRGSSWRRLGLCVKEGAWLGPGCVCWAMFRGPKDVVVRTASKIKGRDIKRFRSDVGSAFHGLTPEEVDAFLPSKAPLECVKLATRTLVYRLQEDGRDVGVPLAFYPDGKNTVIPTVFALWRVPHAVPCLVVPPDVSVPLLNGADLFLPGVMQLPVFDNNAAVAVRVHGNPMPFAVGVSVMSSAAAKAGGMQGRGVHILHTYRDGLWELGGRGAPNMGFLQARVVALTTDDVRDERAPGEPAAGAGSSAGDAAADDAGVPVPVAAAPPTPAVDPEFADLMAAAPEDVEPAAVTDDLSPDDVLFRTFLQALKTKVKDSMLPMLANVLYGTHMLPSRPAGSRVDIKRTAHKKLSVFLEHMAEMGLVAVTVEKGVLALDAVNRAHPDYRAHAVHEETGSGDTDSEAEEDTGGGPALSTYLAASHHQGPIFEAVRRALVVNGQDPPGFVVPFGSKRGGKVTPLLYTKKQVLQVVNTYVKLEGLQHPTRSMQVVLDPALADALYRGVLPKGTMCPAECSKRDMCLQFPKRCRDYFVLRKANGDVVAGAGSSSLFIEVEVVNIKGRKKHMTCVRNTDKFGLPEDQLLRAFQRKFAASATTDVTPDSRMELRVQGNFGPGVVDLLASEFSFPRKLVQVKGTKPAKGGGGRGRRR